MGPQGKPQTAWVAAGGEEWRRCPDCGAPLPAWMKRHRTRTCSGYVKLWAGDFRRKKFAALDAYDGLMAPKAIERPQVMMLTVTAPGVASGLVWDEAVCAHLGAHRHSGELGCRVADAPAAAFNEAAPRWWSELLRVASQATRRETGSAPYLIDRTWEHQKRGVLHVHLLVGYSTHAERVAARDFHVQLQDRAARYGFGYVDRKRQVKAARQAAAYLSGYYLGGKGGKVSLRESVLSRSMPRSISYVRPELSQRSGVTMRSLRLRRYLWRQFRDALAILEGPPYGFTLQELYDAARANVGPAQLLWGLLVARGP